MVLVNNVRKYVLNLVSKTSHMYEGRNERLEIKKRKERKRKKGRKGERKEEK